jgi:hypothetical protein
MDAASSETQPTVGRTTQVVVAILLGLAATGTAWASFQSSLLDGDVVAHYNRGIKQASRAEALNGQGNLIFVRDSALWLEFVKAVETNEDRLRTHIRQSLMSDVLSKAVTWYRNTPRAADPFVARGSPYALPDWSRAEELNALAAQSFDRAEAADTEGDKFELTTVVFAAALFFLGMASVVGRRTGRIAFLIMGVVFVAAAGLMLTAVTLG